MNRDALAQEATVETVQASIAQYGQPPADTHHAHGESGATTVREAEYQGHRIAIRTTYAIEIDGRPLDAHFGVGNDGRVHYHGIPNVDFRSAVDLVKRLIDAFPDDFPAPTPTHTPSTRQSSSRTRRRRPGPADDDTGGHDRHR